MEHLDHDTNNYWEQLERLEKLIRASELKAGVIFSFHSLILGMFVNRIEKLELIITSSTLIIGLSIAWILSIVFSIYFCFRCFRPNLELNYGDNVFFFRDAAYAFGSAKEYSKELIKVCTTNKEIVKQLSYQIHAESIIIDKKFKSVQRALKFFGLSVGFAILILIIWLIQVFVL